MRNFFKAIFYILSLPFRLIWWLFTAVPRWIVNKFRQVHEFFTADVDDAPMTEALAKTAQNPIGLLEHLDALRKHLTRAVLAMVVTTAIAFTFNQSILGFLAAPLEGGMAALVAIEVTEPIGTVMRVSLLTGFALAFPYIAFEVWAFIAPGIMPKSRFKSLIAIPIATFFFLGGMAFAYYVMMPAALPFLLNFMGIATIPRPASYVTFVTGLMFWLGVAFEFPLVIFLMAGLGWVRAADLRAQWRFAVVIIAVAAALITPTVDPVNMSLVMAPMILLYFLSIGLARIAEIRRANR
jgi:sec-independent protein translocase protein TatC